MKYITSVLLTLFAAQVQAAECTQDDLKSIRGKETELLFCHVVDINGKKFAFSLKDYGDGIDDMAGVTIQTHEFKNGSWAVLKSRSGLGEKLIELKFDKKDIAVAVTDLNKNGRNEFVFEIFVPPSVGHLYIFEFEDGGELKSLIKDAPETAVIGKEIVVKKDQVIVPKGSRMSEQSSKHGFIVLKF